MNYAKVWQWSMFHFHCSSWLIIPCRPIHRLDCQFLGQHFPFTLIKAFLILQLTKHVFWSNTLEALLNKETSASAGPIPMFDQAQVFSTSSPALFRMEIYAARMAYTANALKLINHRWLQMNLIFPDKATEVLKIPMTANLINHTYD